MRSLRRIILLILLPTFLYAQRYVFKHFGPEEGLNNLAVQAVLQDSAGFLWVGTQNSLFRFDGGRFREFGSEQGLPDSFVESLHQDARGNLWVATRYGVARLSGDRFERISYTGRIDIVGREAISSDPSGRVYIGTQNGLLLGEPVQTGAKTEYRFSIPAWGSSGFNLATFVDAAGALWFTRAAEVCRWKDGHLTVFGRKDGLPEETWGAILSDARGDLWVRSRKVLMAMRHGQERFERIQGTPDLEAAVHGGISLDQAGRLLLATTHGLAIFDGKRWEVAGTGKGLEINSVMCSTQDKEGTVWVGLGGAGLARWNGYRQWESWTPAEGMAAEGIWALARDGNGSLWIGSDGGVQRMDARGALRTWTERQGLAGHQVRALAVGPDGQVWVGTDPGGLSAVDPRTSRAHSYGIAEGLPRSSVYGLAFDRDQRLWVSTIGLVFRSTGRGGPVHFDPMPVPGSDPAEVFFQITVDEQGVVWIAGTRGVARYDHGRWTRFTKRDGLLVDNAMTATPIRNGAMLIGYGHGHGFSRLSFQQGKPQLIHHSVRDGL